ncbi:Peptidylprolyl isomerase [Bertholletia excelsa]
MVFWAIQCSWPRFKRYLPNTIVAKVISGTVINQRKPYIYSGHSHGERLRITQATLGAAGENQSTTPEKVVVLCKQGNASPVRLCVLIPEHVESQKLQLEFEGKEEFAISVSGNYSVSLSGYYVSGHNGITEDDNDIKEEGTAETESQESRMPKDKNKDKEEKWVRLTPKFPDF